MIECITIANTATFDAPVTLTALKEINFFFGSNGTGKTTVSRVIAEEAKYPECSVTWKGGTRLQPLVYNRDFVERNFHPSSELKGIFTLGEEQKSVLDQIAAAKRDFDALTSKIESLAQGLHGADGKGGKKGELAALEDELKDKCWAQKQKHDSTLQGAFDGYRGNAQKFKEKALQELTTNKADLLSLSELESKAQTVFDATPTPEALVGSIDAAQLLARETDPILKKRVIGKHDVDIAAMIRRLGNSDWVREGREFYDANEAICPFCQQRTTDALARSLSEYFDETFESDTRAIADLANKYATDSARIQVQLVSIIAAPSMFLDAEKLKAEKALLDAKVTLNNQRLAGKKREPSQACELESLSDIIGSINLLIDKANDQASAHNQMVANIKSERTTLTEQVWRFVLEELRVDLSAFKSKKDGLDKAIESMSAAITSAEADRNNKSAEIRRLEKLATSIQPTIDAINGLLSKFGFQSFKLAKAASGNSYKLTRLDGSEANTTLSEGERTFVTFLYFYHLLKGSDSESGMTTDRVVVLDDPVSSLDSDILFIVGSLIRCLFDEVRAGTGHIKQIFVLTHNVYFHKEVTYNSKRKEVALREESFWIVRKSGSASTIESHPSNPIKTSYELLWAEVRKPDRSNLTIQNTLRRILENYFKILGGIDFDKLCGMFDGKDAVVCRSLCSWVHDGSHYAHDDLYVSIDNGMVDSYLRVFRAIFEKSEHSAHFKMMMGDAYVEAHPAATAAAVGLDTTPTRAV
jgi:wobble nucleotide-excising tRNase